MMPALFEGKLDELVLEALVVQVLQEDGCFAQSKTQNYETEVGLHSHDPVPDEQVQVEVNLVLGKAVDP
jgi:hypothetical protein